MAFHPYPQVIPPVFNLGGFGPPRGLTLASPCPWIDHPASGLQPATLRPVQTRFRSGSPSLVNLATDHNSLAHSSKGTPSLRTAEAAHEALTDCRPTVSGTLSLPSRGTFHLSLTVLVRYRSSVVLSLTRWSSQIHAGFPGSGVTRELAAEPAMVRVRGRYPLWRAVPERFHSTTGFLLREGSDAPSLRSHDPAGATPSGFCTPAV